MLTRAALGSHGHHAVQAGRVLWNNRGHIARGAKWAYNRINKKAKYNHPTPKSSRRGGAQVSDHKIASLATMHGGVEKVYKKLHLRKGTKQKLLPGYAKSKYDYYGSNNSNSGRQQYATLFYAGTYQQLLIASGVGYNQQQAPHSLMDYFPYQKTTNASGPAGNVQVAQPAMEKVYIRNINVHMVFSNWNATEADMILYVFEMKKPGLISNNSTGVYQDPFNLWSQGYADAGLGIAAEVQRKLSTVAVLGYGNPSILYEKPTTSDVFKQYWKIVHQEEFRLASGETTRDITLGINYNKMFSRDQLSRYAQSLNSTTTIGVPGTLCFAIVQRGASVGKTLTDNSAAIVPTEIGYVAEVEYILKFPMKNLSTSKVETVVQTQYADATSVTVMNEVDVVQTIPGATTQV